jgi:D-alanine-D-alanine ligase
VKVAIIYNKDVSKVINIFGMQNKEMYNPETVKKVAKCLEDGGHNVGIIDGDMHVIDNLQDFMPKVVEGEKMGMVFNMAYGIQGESRYTHIPAMLEMLGIPYVGSSPAGHALALDKVVTKMILQQHNLSTPKFWVFSTHEFKDSNVEFPVIVKPKMESVSFGLRIVDNYEDLREAVKFIVNEFQQPALVEQFIAGREFAVGLLGNNPVEAFPILEIDLENDPDAIQTYEHKSHKPRKKICPANLDKEKAEEMIKLSIDAFNALQLKDFARVDFRMDKEGNVYILELNSMASLGPTGSYPHAASVAGYDYKTLVNKMLDVAVNRYFTTDEFATEADRVYKKVPLHVRVRGFLRGRQSQIETMLKEMVNINTYVRNVEGIKKLSNLIKKQFSQLGFSFQSFPQVEVGSSLFFSNTDEDKIDILLLGNLDIDTKSSNHEYYHDSEQKIYGSGIWEIKGGLVVLISALQALRFVKIMKKLKVGILLTSDNSLQGKFASSLVKRVSQNAEYVLGLHGGSLNNSVVTSRSGAAVYNSQMYLLNNKDAKYVAQSVGKFSKLLTSWTELSKPDEGLVIAPQQTQIESNITEPYAHASVNLSVRFNDKKQMEEVDEKIKKLIPKKSNKIYEVQIEGGVRRPSMLRNERVEELYQKLKSIADKLDINLKEEHRWSSADVCFVDENKYLIDGIGPVGMKPSNKSEYILKHSLLERSTLLAAFLSELNNK